jgi:3-oxoacyl-[acyl-carrier protein] reductase
MSMAAGREWVVITGAAGAIGRAFVRHYLARDRTVLALDRNVAALADVGGDCVVREVDLTEDAAVKTVLDGVLSAADRVPLLINAVGLIWNEPLLALRGGTIAVHTAASWRRVIEANLTAPFIAASLLAARMARAGGGAIVNFSSIASGGNAGQTAYAAAKAGIEGLTKTMAAELGPFGIRVNAVALGFIDAPTTHAALPQGQATGLAARTPLGRLGQIDEVIGAVEFLAENSFTTGAVLRVDGGLRL